jgi:hypothetical protein
MRPTPDKTDYSKEQNMIVVCGDSWMTTDVRYPGAHFSEILKNQYGYTVINLARGGMSNVGICFQIEQALKFKPKTILFNQTDAQRMAFSIDKFQPELGLQNIRYTDSVSGSCGSSFVGDEKSPIIDDVLSSLINDYCWTIGENKSKYNLTEEQKTAIMYYTTYLFDEKFNEVLQSWMFRYWCYEAERHKIKMVDPFDELYDFTVNHPQWLQGDKVFHTEIDFQQEFAEKIHLILQNIDNNENTDTR